MKLKKNIKFKDGNQVFRILISPKDKLVVETRDTESREAFYNSIDLTNGKKLFTGKNPLHMMRSGRVAL